MLWRSLDDPDSREKICPRCDGAGVIEVDLNDEVDDEAD